MAATPAHVPPPKEENVLRSREDAGIPLLGAERVTTEPEGRAVQGAGVKRSCLGMCLEASKSNVFAFIELLLALLAMLSKNTFQTVLNEKGARRSREGPLEGPWCRSRLPAG